MKTNKIKIINLTPHSVRILDSDNNVVREYKSEGVIRLSEKRSKITEIDGIALFQKTFGTTDLPEPQPNTYYIVSSLVAQMFPNRKDLLIPDQIVRDKDGRIIGCRSFSIFGGHQ